MGSVPWRVGVAGVAAVVEVGVLELGWIGARGASDLVLLNSADLSEVAVLELPLAIPHGLHGSWAASV